MLVKCGVYILHVCLTRFIQKCFLGGWGKRKCHKEVPESIIHSGDWDDAASESALDSPHLLRTAEELRKECSETLAKMVPPPPPQKFPRTKR
eukprot:5632164-Amphidinium_carterae.1